MQSNYVIDAYDQSLRLIQIKIKVNDQTLSLSVHGQFTQLNQVIYDCSSDRSFRLCLISALISTLIAALVAASLAYLITALIPALISALIADYVSA